MIQVNFHQKAIIYRPDGRFLAVRATYKQQRWDLPGGKVEIPETHDAALAREILEETGLQVTDIRPIDVQTAFNQLQQEYVIFVGHDCRVITDTVTLSREHDEFRWVNDTEFQVLDATPYLKELVQRCSVN